MHYTIANFQTPGGDFQLDFDKVGNSFMVYCRVASQRGCEPVTMSANRTFEEADEAANLFQRISRNILLGRYSYEDLLKMVEE